MTKKATTSRARSIVAAALAVLDPLTTTAATTDAATTTAPEGDAPEVQVLEAMPVTRLETARALPELLGDEGWRPVVHGIQSFKDDDRRTMNVVAVDGMVFKHAAA